jgi:hypothetical protein
VRTIPKQNGESSVGFVIALSDDGRGEWAKSRAKAGQKDAFKKGRPATKATFADDQKEAVSVESRKKMTSSPSRDVNENRKFRRTLNERGTSMGKRNLPEKELKKSASVDTIKRKRWTKRTKMMTVEDAGSESSDVQEWKCEQNEAD